MERRARPLTPPPLTRTLAQINAAELSLLAERKRAEELEIQKQAIKLGPKVLAPATPPKKRFEENFEFGRAPPNPFVEGFVQERVVEYRETFSVIPAIASTSKFASHESALSKPTPVLKKSTFAAGLKNVSAREKITVLEQSALRSQGFGQPAAITTLPRQASRAQINDRSRASLSKSIEEKSKNGASGVVSGSSKGPSMTRHLPTASASVVESSLEENSISEIEEEEEEDELDVIDGPTKPKSRNRDGTIIERIPLGPIRHAQLKHDPLFNSIEPNSGIRLRSRTLEHSAVQSHLDSRYHLSPALLYSIIRPAEKGSGYLEVPLVGDYIIIGVLAQKDERRFVRGDALKGDVKEDVKPKRWNGVEGADEEKDKAGQVKEQDELFAAPTTKQKEKKYIKFTLVDLSTESAAQSGTGTLTLLLFESEASETIDENGKKKITYRGGSGGAYEKWWSQSVGAVVGILNPRVMKQKIVPGIPSSNTISISPDSADSMMLIGRAQDLTCCQARTAGGKVCGDWCDIRVNSVCNYHLASRVKSTGASRPETNSSNSSHTATTSFSRKGFQQSLRTGGKVICDPKTKTGLLPRNNSQLIDGAMTYVTAGNAIAPKKLQSVNGLRAAAIQSGNGSGGYVQGFRDGPTVDEARKAQKDQRDAKLNRELEMKNLLKGMKADNSAGGTYLKLQATQKKERARKEAKELDYELDRSLRKSSKRMIKEVESEESEEEEMALATKRSKPFSTTALRLIGYDPTSNGEIGREEDELTKKKRLSAISLLSSNADRLKPNLKPPPGIRIRSGVVVPGQRASQGTAQERLEDSDDDLVVEGGPA